MALPCIENSETQYRVSMWVKELPCKNRVIPSFQKAGTKPWNLVLRRRLASMAVAAGIASREMGPGER